MLLSRKARAAIAEIARTAIRNIQSSGRFVIKWQSFRHHPSQPTSQSLPRHTRCIPLIATSIAAIRLRHAMIMTTAAARRATQYDRLRGQEGKLTQFLQVEHRSAFLTAPVDKKNCFNHSSTALCVSAASTFKPKSRAVGLKASRKSSCIQWRIISLRIS